MTVLLKCQCKVKATEPHREMPKSCWKQGWEANQMVWFSAWWTDPSLGGYTHSQRSSELQHPAQGVECAVM